MSSNGKNGNGRLTNKQAAFADEYLIDFNATRASERAGYSGDSATLAATGSRLLKLDKVWGRIQARLQEKAMSADEVLMRLAEQARVEQSHYLQADGTIDLASLLLDGKGHLVKGTKWDRDGRLVVEFYDAQSALIQLGKVYGVFREVTEHRGDITFNYTGNAREDDV